MSFREFLFYSTGIELYTSEPLRDKKLPPIVIKKPLPPMPKTEQEKREELYNTMIVKKEIRDLEGRLLIRDVRGMAEAKANKIISNRGQYQAISGAFSNPIRWLHIGLIHELECSQNFNCYLGNGQAWNKVTTIVPKGRGAFKSFREGAIDAIKLQGLDKVEDWSIGNMLYIMEGFNGYGYSKYKGINSPYLWSGSNQYQAGKYITDGVYSKTAVSQQIGIAVIYKRLMELI